MPKWINNIISLIKETLTQPSAQLSRGQQLLRFWMDLARHCTIELKHDRAPQMAAALTYHTLFSLMPTLVLALVVMQGFVGKAERDQFKQTVVDMALSPITNTVEKQIDKKIEDAAEKQADKQSQPSDAPDNNTDDTTQPDTNTDTSPKPNDDALDPDRELTEEEEAILRAEAKREEFERMRADLETQIQNIMSSLENVNFKSIGIVGILVFIWGATGLIVTIEKSFNSIFGVESGRAWYMRLPLYYFVITLGPIMMLAGIWAQNQFFALMQQISILNWVVGSAGVLMPLITTWLALLVVFILLPTAKVTIRAAALGSFTAALGWVIAANLFSIYVKTAAISTLYGALALMPLFLLWLWITWLIILFGLELTYTLQHMKGKRFKSGDHDQRRHLLIDSTWLTALAGLLAEAFKKGDKLDVDELVKELDLPATTISPMLDALVEARVAHRFETEDEISYTLARPAERVSIQEVMQAAQKLQPNAMKSKLPAWGFVRETTADILHKSRDQTLADLID